MCTMITTQTKVEGVGKGASGWFNVREANVSYDHPFELRAEHALNIDFVNEAAGPGARVAVELTADSARELVKAIMKVLEQADAGGWTEESAQTPEHSHAESR